MNTPGNNDNSTDTPDVPQTGDTPTPPSSNDEANTPNAAPKPPPKTFLQKLDDWVAYHPWHPRILPLFLYVAVLFPAGLLREDYPLTYPIIVTLQVAIIALVAYRYRKLLPELNFKFHYLAIPVGIAGVVAWIALAELMMSLSDTFVPETHNFFEETTPAIAWASMITRFAAMCIMAPLVEEIFYRSALLRSFYKPTALKHSTIDLLSDFPVIGDRIAMSKLGREADNHPKALATAFHETPLGAVSTFAVIASLITWCILSHIPRDYPGTFACGFLYIFILWYTNRPNAPKKYGLGPVIWAHAITNALLWAYTLYYDDWLYL